MPHFFAFVPILGEDHFRGVKIYQAAIARHQYAFVRNVRGVNLADNLGSLFRTRQQDDVRGILCQPDAIRDGKVAGLQAVAFQKGGSLPGASPNGDAEACSLPAMKLRGDTVTGVDNPSHAIRIGRTGNNFSPIAYRVP